MANWFHFTAAGMEHCHGKYVVKDGRDFMAFIQPAAWGESPDYWLTLTLTQMRWNDHDPDDAVKLSADGDIFRQADTWLKDNGYEDAE